MANRVIIPLSALRVEKELQSLYDEMKNLGYKITYCYNMTDAELDAVIALVNETRHRIEIVRAELTALLGEAKPA